MIRRKYSPKGLLQQYVKSILYYRDYNPISKKERLLPNGLSQLIINLGNRTFRHFEGPNNNKEREYPSAIIAGIQTKNIFLDSSSRLSTMHVVLRPGALPAMFNVPAHAFKNQMVDLDTIAGYDMAVLRERLIEATNPEDKFQLLEAFLLSRLDRTYQPNPAVMFSIEQLENRNGTLLIKEIRDKVGYSQRHFSELFKKLLGVAPKQYARICRFQGALSRIQGMKVPDWTSIAIDSGYYDQPHFNHEFKSFSGLSPTEYYHNQSEEMNHLPA